MDPFRRDSDFKLPFIVYILFIRVCTYVRLTKRIIARTMRPSDGETRVRSSNERIPLVAIPFIRIKRSMNRYSIEPIDIIHDIVLHKDSRSGKTYYNKISFLRMVLLHLECLEIAEEIDFYERGFFETRISASLFFLRINRKE